VKVLFMFQSPPHRGVRTYGEDLLPNSRLRICFNPLRIGESVLTGNFSRSGSIPKTCFNPLRIGESVLTHVSARVRKKGKTGFNPLRIGESVLTRMHTLCGFIGNLRFQSPPHRGVRTYTSFLVRPFFLSRFQSPPHRGVRTYRIKSGISRRRSVVSIPSASGSPYLR